MNKKALDQFVSFTEQKEKLMNRKSEIDAGHEVGEGGFSYELIERSLSLFVCLRLLLPTSIGGILLLGVIIP